MLRSIRKLIDAINPSKKARVAKRCERRAALGVESLENRDLMTIFGPIITVPGTVIGNPVIIQPVNPPTVAGPLIDFIQREYALTATETDCNGTSVQKILGAATSGEIPVPNVAGASMETYQGGTIYFSPDSGAHVVYGDIATKYASPSAGGPAGYGLPTSDEAPLSGVPGVRITTFLGNNRAIVWSPSYGPHLIYGSIGAEYSATANETDHTGTSVQKILGAPTSDEMSVPNMTGFNRMNTFVGGTIYYSAGTNAHVVYGSIGNEYAALKGPTGSLGLPTSDEADLPGLPGGRVTYFANGQAIIWRNTTNKAIEVQGDILTEYKSLLAGNQTDANGNRVGSFLGAPTNDLQYISGVSGAPDAHKMTFEGGTIYGSSSTMGAHVVYGDIAAKYNALGGPTGSLGLPIGDEGNALAGRIQIFQHGTLVRNPQTHVVTILTSAPSQGTPAPQPVPTPSAPGITASVSSRQWIQSPDGYPEYQVTITVDGTGFSSNKNSVRLRVVTTEGELDYYLPLTGGKFHTTLTLLVDPQLWINLTATDGTQSQQGLTGYLWSNAVHLVS
jgi:LGFP repeat